MNPEKFREILETISKISGIYMYTRRTYEYIVSSHFVQTMVARYVRVMIGGTVELAGIQM